eukprot:scaffold437_cov168-Ochromonas_danica.AAC.67
MNEQSPLLNSDHESMPAEGEAFDHSRSPVQPLPPAPLPLSNPSSHRLFSILNLILFFLIVCLGWVKYDSDHRIGDLSAQIATLSTRLEKVEKQSDANFFLLTDNLQTVQEKEKELESFASGLGDNVVQLNRSHDALSRVVGDHGKALARLSNGTSNADVLDKLRETKESLAKEMDLTKRNVSAVVSASQEEVETAKAVVTQRLDHTVLTVRAVVQNATEHIHQVQRNVTGQLDGMSARLAATVADLSAAVDSAKEAIHSEVDVVQANIEQYVAITNKQFAAENDFVKYQVAGTFTLLSVLIFLAHITSHARHYHKPDAQRRIMAVLWMVPVYSITSWLSLVRPDWEGCLSSVRDIVEAYVIYTFVGLLVAVLGDGLSFPELIDKLAAHVRQERRAVERFKQRQLCKDEEEGRTVLEEADREEDDEGGGGVLPTGRPKEHIVPPCSCPCSCECLCGPPRDPEAVAKAWLWQCQILAMQFVFVKPFSTFLPFVLQLCGVYDEEKAPAWWEDGQVNWQSPRLYVLIVQNLSVALAFTGLLSFFHGAEAELEWCNPWPKFLCIKGVVFATFWQNIVLQGMSTYGLVDERTAAQCQNLLICVEMLIASIAHLYVFPHHEWAPNYQRDRQRSLLLKDTMALGDFYRDMRRLVTPWQSALVQDQIMQNLEKLQETSHQHSQAILSEEEFKEKEEELLRQQPSAQPGTEAGDAGLEMLLTPSLPYYQTGQSLHLTFSAPSEDTADPSAPLCLLNEEDGNDGKAPCCSPRDGKADDVGIEDSKETQFER